MRTVAKNLWSTTYTIKNSKFEVFIDQVSTAAEVETFLQSYQEQKATHNCYAYIIDFEKQIKKFNDDSEPSKSAGFAILKILQEKQIVNIIVLVRRYFQPPKLGLGHLMRAYQYGLLKYLKEVALLEVITSKEYQLTLPSNLVNLIYQWQKQYHFIILKQMNDGLNVIFIINIASSNDNLPYHLAIEKIFLKDSFIISDN